MSPDLQVGSIVYIWDASEMYYGGLRIVRAVNQDVLSLAAPNGFQHECRADAVTRIKSYEPNFPGVRQIFSENDRNEFLIPESAYPELCMELDAIKAEGPLRRGQLMYTRLSERYREVAQAICGLPCDPFYGDEERISLFKLRLADFTI
jgi:hypothetical protein